MRWSTPGLPGPTDDVVALAEVAAGVDGVSAFSDPTRRDLAGGARATSWGLRRWQGETLVGYAHVDAALPEDVVVELVVHPGHRRRGVGDALAGEVLAAYPKARAWAHGDHPGAAALAARHGMTRDRELWQMRRDPAPLPPVVVPDGVRITPLVVGVDEEAVVAVNNRAFAWHPEQGHWDVEAVRALEREPWFDAAGVLLAREATAGDAGRGGLLGFHWTKVHERSASVPEPLGEVYVIGVDPAAQGRRLGAALTLAGLHHLAGRGLEVVILYVEGDNDAAIATYRRLGFERAGVDVSYAPAGSVDDAALASGSC